MNTISQNDLAQYKPTDKDRVIKLNSYQDDFIFTKAKYPCLVAGWGTGKTLAFIEKIRLAAEMYPKNRIMILRKEYTDLKDSTIKDWNDYTNIKVGSNKDAEFPNGSVVMFRHAEELKGNNLNNVTLGGFGIEQGEEFETDDVFFKLQGRLRLPKVPLFGCVIANTNGHNWIYNRWKVNNTDKDYILIEANSFDNEHNLPESTINDWRKLKDKKPKMYNRFVMNSWEDSDTTDLIIYPEWIRNCIGKTIFEKPNEYKRIISIDVARFGDDKTVMYAIENNRCVAKEVMEKKSTMEIVGRAQIFAAKHLETDNYAVDEIGVGGGVIDRLIEIKKNVVSVNGSRKASDKFCYNLRAEIYKYGADMIEGSNCSILESDYDLIDQLSWAKYKEIKSSGLFQVEAKEDIKKRHGRSPDDADAFLNGLWALQQIQSKAELAVLEVDGWVPPTYRMRVA